MHKVVEEFEERLKNYRLKDVNVTRKGLFPPKKRPKNTQYVHDFTEIQQWFRSTVQEDPNFPIYYNWKRVKGWDDSNLNLDLISHENKKIRIAFQFTPGFFATIDQNFYSDSYLPHTSTIIHTSTEFKQWILRQHNPKFIQTIMFLHENGISKNVKYEQFIHWTQIYDIHPPTIVLQNGYVFGKLTFDEDRYFAQYVVNGQRDTTFLTFDDLRQWILQSRPNVRHSLQNQCYSTYYTKDSKY